MPSMVKSLFLVVAASATMMVTARDLHSGREPRGFVRNGHRKGSRHLQKEKDPKEPKGADVVFEAGLPPKASKKAKAPGSKAPSTKKSKKGGIPPPPPPPPGGFRVELPLEGAAFFLDERLGNVTFDIFGNETFGNETFTNETFAPTALFTNETLPPTNETDLLASGNDTLAVTSNETLPPASGLRLKLVGDESSCVTYNQSAVEVVNCDVAGDLADWEILESSDPGLFQLRHVESQLCLPENPESPDRAFNCWISEVDKAIGDTINGLVNCSSAFAAFVGFVDPANPTYLYNAICSTGVVGAPMDVVLMAYTEGGTTEVLWGEKILLDVPQMRLNETYALSGSFFLAEA